MGNILKDELKFVSWDQERIFWVKIIYVILQIYGFVYLIIIYLGKVKFLVYMLFVCGLYIGFYVKGVFKGLEVEVRVCDWKICLEG